MQVASLLLALAPRTCKMLIRAGDLAKTGDARGLVVKNIALACPSGPL